MGKWHTHTHLNFDSQFMCGGEGAMSTSRWKSVISSSLLGKCLHEASIYLLTRIINRSITYMYTVVGLSAIKLPEDIQLLSDSADHCTLLNL